VTDERQGLPSASNLERLATCRGSLNAEIGLPDEPNEMSRAGDVGHACLAGEVHIDELDDETAKTVGRCQTLERSILVDLDMVDAEQVREVRFWLEIEGRRLFSGKPDLVAIEGTRALVVDYKTGPVAVESAASNMQLRALAVLVFWKYNHLEEITTAIIQPRAFDQQATLTTYKVDDIWEAYYELLLILEEAQETDAPRKASEKACRYCKAKTTCPEAQKSITDIAKVESNLPEIPSANLLEKCAIAKSLIAKVEAIARKALEADPNAIAGYELKQGAKRQKITNPEGVFFKASIIGIDGQEFSAVCDVNKSKLKALIKSKTEKKGKALDEELADILEGNTEETRNKPSLAKSKPSLAKSK
tara:strand:- start:533 stop:1618 length:1086 start_codon:yes stop_codon:yes gene_type:complete